MQVTSLACQVSTNKQAIANHAAPDPNAHRGAVGPGSTLFPFHLHLYDKLVSGNNSFFRILG